MKVLHIEDDVAFANILKRRLAKHGIESQNAADHSQALLMARQFCPNVIILDMHLGADSGLLLIEPLKKFLPNSRIILLTGYASIATAVKAMKLGADDYLAKPVDTETILRVLHGDDENNALTTSTLDTAPQKLSAEQAEWEHIQQVLKIHEGNVSAAARHLSMHRRTLQRKLKKRPSFHDKS
ncbi:DNA-binding response regulator [Thalassotalea marina]|uniref:DNA-binding response regulator n=2 Tax=Thalassotalea marina TaxID=1673741 RepID=A0A919BP97_9GAMM|nr:DNA-binding response regulator [Thalassotalea marina]